LTGKKLIHGYLDRLRENLEVLDEQIANARKMSTPGRKGMEKAAALQWAKTLRDLVDLRNTTLEKIKAHVLGVSETGSVREPADHYSGNSEVMFERDFARLLSPWTRQDLKLECVDCGKESEDVSTRRFPREYQTDELFDLCDRCYEKRTAKDTDESEESSEASDPVSILKEFAETQGKGNVNSTMSEDRGLEGAMTDGVRNIIRLVRSGGSPAEKIKMLEEFKAHLVTIGYNHASGPNIEPGVALLDKEIERLRAEAGKAQDAAGKPVTILPP
jgi:hypothetical protein